MVILGTETEIWRKTETSFEVKAAFCKRDSRYWILAIIFMWPLHVSETSHCLRALALGAFFPHGGISSGNS